MFDREGRLDIFENFRIDRNLKKYRKREQEDSDEEGMSEDMYLNKGFNSGFVISPSSVGVMVSAMEAATQKLAPKMPWWKFWAKAPPPPAKPPEPPPEITIEKFFVGVKASAERLEVVRERAKGYEEALRNAKASGQQALFESLSKNLVATRSEAHLVSMGLAKYLTEEKVVEFVKKAPKGLRLDWIANFIKIIPPELLKVKVECDNQMLFDNYVILHFDPNAKSYAETEAEREAKKDPILFGVIDGRRRLYYLGDWVDELCDLTLDQVADVLGSGGVSEIKGAF